MYHQTLTPSAVEHSLWRRVRGRRRGPVLAAIRTLSRRDHVLSVLARRVERGAARDRRRVFGEVAADA